MDLPSLLEDVDVLSLDIFDTALHRIFRKPEDLFWKLRSDLLTSDLAVCYPDVVRNIPYLRIQAEQQARDGLIRLQGTPEVTIEDIYETLTVLAGISKKHAAFIMEREIEIELQSCYANTDILKLYSCAMEQNIKVVFCSDMYLPRRTLEQMLIRSGYCKNLVVLVSGELKLSKHEGTIFPFLMQKFGVPKDRILHVGDNEHADVIMPRKIGLRAFHFVSGQTPERNTSGPDLKGTDRLVYSVCRGLTIKDLNSVKKDPYPFPSFSLEKIGYRVFGPLFAGFFFWILDKVQTAKPDKVLFFARDAFVFKQLWDEFKEWFEVKAKSEYVYISRASVTVPSLTDIDLSRLWALTGGRKPRTVKSVLESIGLEPNFFLDSAAQLGLDLEEEVQNGDPRLFRLLANEYHHLIQLAEKRRNLPERYFRDLIGEAERVVLVDIGWTGTLQSALIRLLPNRYRFHIVGFYIGLETGAKAKSMGSQLHGWLMNEGEPHRWRTAMLSGGTELLELALVAPHGTTLGYTWNDRLDCVEPLLEDTQRNEQEQKYLEAASEIQRGALRFVRDVIAGLGLTQKDVSILAASYEWAEPFYQLVMQPALEEAELLGDIEHSDSMGRTQERLALAKRLSKKDRRLPKTRTQERALAFWKAGFDVRNSAR